MNYASPRYAPIVLLVLIAAGISSTYLRNHPRRVETCRSPEELIASDDLELDGYTLTVSEELQSRERNPRLDGYLVPESPRDTAMSFTIRRALELVNWVVRPTTALPGPAEPIRFREVVVVIDGSEVPIQFAYGMHRGVQRFVAYALAYDGKPIRYPFWVRMFQAPGSLLNGVRPITYIGVAGAMSNVDMPRHEQSAIDFISTGWRHYRKACGP